MTDIAAEALCLQPKGYTLQTTEVWPHCWQIFSFQI